MRAAVAAQRHQSRAGDQKRKVSVGRGDDLEAGGGTVGLDSVHRGGGGTGGGGEVHRRAAFARPLWWRRAGRWDPGAALGRVRRVEVGGADLGHTGRQVAEEAGPGVQVDAVTRGQEAGDLSRTLTEPGSVFAQEGRVHAHGRCKDGK